MLSQLTNHVDQRIQHVLAEERKARSVTDASIVAAIERLTTSQLALQASLKRGKKKARTASVAPVTHATLEPISPLRGTIRAREEGENSGDSDSEDEIDKWADGEMGADPDEVDSEGEVPAGGSGSGP